MAFPAEDRAGVDAFHRAALAAGYRDNGEPGLRPEYHAGYYGAFVLDPDGNNIEAVFTIATKRATGGSSSCCRCRSRGRTTRCRPRTAARTTR